MNWIPSRERKSSKHSKYSCVQPGPPCSVSHLDWTRAYPFGPDMKLAVHLHHLDAAHFHSAHSCILSSRAGGSQTGYVFSWSSSALASFRSAVSKPSLNQP